VFSGAKFIPAVVAALETAAAVSGEYASKRLIMRCKVAGSLPRTAETKY
jgi:hypothetical protein